MRFETADELEKRLRLYVERKVNDRVHVIRHDYELIENDTGTEHFGDEPGTPHKFADGV